MPRKKTDEVMSAAVQTADFIETNDTVSETDDSIFAENEQVSESDDSPDIEEKSGVFIALKKGGSYHFRDWKFVKNKPVPVPSELAERLMKTGFFELSGA